MNTVIFYTLSACAGGTCPNMVVQAAPAQPAPVVIYQEAPRPLLQILAPRPKTVIISAPACVGGFCPR
jgi:hypothetical protein